MKLKHVAISLQVVTVILMACTLLVLCRLSADMHLITEMFQEQYEVEEYHRGGYE